MDVRCPKHGLSLSTEKRQFTFGDKVYPAVIGNCPKCRFLYINRKIFPGDSTTIENNTYQFLKDLELVFPPERIIDRSAPVTKTNPKKEKDSPKEQTKKKDKQKKEEKKAKKEKKKEKQNGAERTTKKVKTQVGDFFHHSDQLVLHDSHKFVPMLTGRCPEDGYALQYKLIQVKTKGVIVKESGAKCPRCRMVYFSEDKRESIRKKANEVIAYKAHKAAPMNTAAANTTVDIMKSSEKAETQNEKLPVQNIPLPYADGNGKVVNLSRERTTVWVYENKCRCLACERKFQQKTITNRTAVVQNAMRENIHVDVMFCMGCGRYFVNVLTLEMKEKTYGILMFERRYMGTLAQRQVSRFNFAEDSILSRYGYSVADKDGISKEYRQAILTYIMESVGIGKNEVEEKIKEFIRIHSKIKGHEAACGRWLEDLLFVSDYKIRDQKRVYNPQFEQACRKGGGLR